MMIQVITPEMILMTINTFTTISSIYPIQATVIVAVALLTLGAQLLQLPQQQPKRVWNTDMMKDTRIPITTATITTAPVLEDIRMGMMGTHMVIHMVMMGIHTIIRMDTLMVTEEVAMIQMVLDASQLILWYECS